MSEITVAQAVGAIIGAVVAILVAGIIRMVTGTND